MALIIGLLFAVATLITYREVQLRLEGSALATLDSYADDIVRQQEDRFAAITSIEVRARNLFLAQLATRSDYSQQAFDRLFLLQIDGTRRSVDGLFDGMTTPDGTPVRGIGGFIGSGRNISPDHRRQIMTALTTLRLLSTGMSADIKNLFYFTPQNDLMMFAPSRPDRLTFYRRTAPASFDFQHEEFMHNMQRANNPARLMKCTALQPIVYDRTRRTWTTGCMLPVDYEGHNIGGWGVSLLLDDVFNAAQKGGLRNAKVILLSREGRLIYHPDFTRQSDFSTRRYLDLTTTTDPQLRALWSFFSAHRTTGVASGRISALHGIAAMRPVPTPGWYAVVFYPDAVVSSLSQAAARTVLAIGLFCLILQALIVGYVMRHRVGRPIAELTRRAEAMRALATSLPSAGTGTLPAGRDEVERLNAAFDLMAATVGAERDRLTRSFDWLAQNVGEYAIYMLDDAGCVTAWNRGAERIIGYLTAEILGRTSDRFFTAADQAAGVPRQHREAALSSGRFTGEGWRCRADGSMFWASVVMEPVYAASGELAGFAKILRDKTDARQVELALHESLRRSRLAEDTAELGYWRIDLRDNSIVMSDWTCMIHGIAPGSTASLEAMRQTYLPEDRPRVDALAVTAIKTGGPLVYRAQIVRPDARIRTVEVRGIAELDGARASALFGTMRDVTNEVEASQRLVAARDAAASAADARTNLLATMSHEIRTPMTGILGMLELLRAQAPGDDGAALASIKQSAQSLMIVLDDVIDHAALEQSEVTFERVAFDLPAMLRNCAALFGALAQAKGLTLACDVGDTLMVLGDPSRVQQIVSNFLSNAIKFTAGGSVTISSTRLPSGKMRITVTDTGIGFDPATAARLFLPFVQDQSSTRRRFGGSGLGLSICRRLAEAMGGDVGVDSAMGGGSSFWVDLPLEATTLRPLEPKDGSVPLLYTRQGTAPRILVADDIETTRIVAEAHLRVLGCEVTCVGDGVAVLEQLAAGSYDVVLLDDHMPRLDGSAVARLAPLLPSGHPPMISFSASGGQRANAKACAATLAKPFTQQSLRSTLDAVLSDISLVQPSCPAMAVNVLEGMSPFSRAKLGASFERDLAGIGACLAKELADGDAGAAQRTLHALIGCADGFGAKPLAAASRFGEALLAAVAPDDCPWLGAFIDRHITAAQTAVSVVSSLAVAGG